jgi:hypothetical protein
MSILYPRLERRFRVFGRILYVQLPNRRICILVRDGMIRLIASYLQFYPPSQVRAQDSTYVLHIGHDNEIGGNQVLVQKNASFVLEVTIRYAAQPIGYKRIDRTTGPLLRACSIITPLFSSCKYEDRVFFLTSIICY